MRRDASDRKTEIVDRWTYEGRECEVVKHWLGHYCGYTVTAAPQEIDGDLDRLSVHGGITYGPDGNGVIGFDCSHAGDVCVDDDGEPISELDPFIDRQTWRAEDVKQEVESLVDQLTTLEIESSRDVRELVDEEPPP